MAPKVEHTNTATTFVSLLQSSKTTLCKLSMHIVAELWKKNRDVMLIKKSSLAYAGRTPFRPMRRSQIEATQAGKKGFAALHLPVHLINTL